mmetsp:Transcript_15758/g.33305  ORF Transcript_15758/g.33305 Transcript_15758/m.33305 type:complete len:99 (+) Transcript_15758:232-528(+)
MPSSSSDASSSTTIEEMSSPPIDKENRTPRQSCLRSQIATSPSLSSHSVVSKRTRFRETPCMESFELFKRCSTNSSDTVTFSCGAAVASYMKCALNQC